MTEPSARATFIETVVPGLIHWSLDDDRIGSRTHCYGIKTDQETILIDPLPLAVMVEHLLEDVTTICLTGRFHQRSAWRYQEKFDAQVYAPEKGKGYEGTPDHFYEADDILPGGLQVIHAPGPTDAHYVFYLDHEGEKVMFIADLLTRQSGDDYFKFVPGEYMDNPDITRESVRMLLDYPIDILCPNHGNPVIGDVHEALEEALEKDEGR